MPIYRQPPGLFTGDFSSNDGFMNGVPFGRSPERWAKYGGRGATPVDICTRQENAGTIKRNLGAVFVPADLNASEVWANSNERGGNFTKRSTGSVTAEALGTSPFLGGPSLTGNPNGLQCYSTTDDASFSGPTTNNLLWKASNTTNGTGSMFGLITVCNATNRFRTSNTSLQQFHTFFAQTNFNRTGFTNGFPDFTAGYCFGVQKNTNNLELRVANGSGNSRLVLPMQETFSWPREFGSLGIFFFSKYFIRPIGQTGNWTSVLDIGYHSAHDFGFQYVGGQISNFTNRMPYIVARLEGPTELGTLNARFIEECDGTSGVNSNFRMCIGGLNQSTYDATKRCNSCCQILEAYVGNDEDTAASGKLGAIVGEMIEEKEVFLEDKQAFYDVRHAGFCSAYGIGHVDQYLKYLHTTYGQSSFFQM